MTDTGAFASLTGTFFLAVAHKSGDYGTVQKMRQAEPDLETSGVHRETEAPVFLLAAKIFFTIKRLR